MNKFLIIPVLCFCFAPSLFGQETGWISGSFESNTHYYLDDNALGIDAPLNPLASNNYLWVQFNKGPVTAGLQLESYMPPTIGYPNQLEGTKISHRFLRVKKGFLDLTAGNFYEQFGSGLSFRSYEDRALGINNSMDGIRLILTPASWIGLKGVYGKQRKYEESADGYLRGIDGYIDFGPMFKWDNSIKLGTGVISKYESYLGPDDDFPRTVNVINSRISADIASFSLYSEFVVKSADPTALNLFNETRGSAFSTHASVTRSGFVTMLALRFLNNMDFRIEREALDTYSAINYLPANTRQHIYLLSNIYPYPTQAEAEASVQADIFYTIPRKTAIGGPYGTKVRMNYAHVRDLQPVGENAHKTFSFGDKLYYADFNLEINRKWGRQVRTILFFQALSYNKGEIELTGGKVKSRILVGDLRYSFTRRFSMKTELQHLWTKDDYGNWFAGLLELSYAPGWSVFFSDMTNYRYDDPVHYLRTGISYSNPYFRIAIGYGRNRAGYICSGGVCQIIPAYTGFNMNISSSF